jgi:hypothetical protein
MMKIKAMTNRILNEPKRTLQEFLRTHRGYIISSRTPFAWISRESSRVIAKKINPTTRNKKTLAKLKSIGLLHCLRAQKYPQIVWTLPPHLNSFGAILES